MIRKAIWSCAGVSLLAVTLLSAQNAMESYQRGLVEERAAGNLKQAIEFYERAAKEAGRDRALAARALIRAAASYQKLGEPRAAELYEQVVRTYPEQREQVRTAQLQLATLRRLTPARAQAPPDVSSVLDPVLKTYCTTCHNQTRKVAGLTLDNLDSKNVGKDAEVWERVLRRLLLRFDPPTGIQRPDESTYQSAVAALEVALDHAHPLNTPLNTSDLVSDSELAWRLAKVIWNSTPDEALLDAANRGTLRDPSVLTSQVQRMLRDAKSAALVSVFFAKWLSLSRATAVNEDALEAAFQRETELFLETQIREDRGAMELWTANYTFVNERLARHYGISFTPGEEYRRVTLTESPRRGLLGHGGFLALTSMPNRTSPTLRGKWVLSTFFGVQPPPPPPNIPPLPEGSGPMRKRIEDATSAPACRSCHRMFDPLGFALENFDNFGQWRNVDSGVPVDASGSFRDGTTFNGPAEFHSVLSKYRDAFVTNLIERLLSYSLGRGAERRRIYAYEMPAVRAILREAAANDYRWSSLIVGIAKSTSFQMKNIVP